MMRWSNDSASVVTERDLPSAVHPRLLADRAEGENRGLARIDDRRPGVDAEDADVGDRECPALHVGDRRAAFAGSQRERIDRARNCASDNASAFLMLGTTRPRGVAAAIPRFT